MYILVIIPFEVICQRLHHPSPPLYHHITSEPQELLNNLSLQVLSEDRGQGHVGHGEGEEADLGPGA